MMNDETRKQDEKRQTRKKYAPRGERTQTMMAFKLDNDLKGWVNEQLNKGRYICNLIRKDMMERKLRHLERETDEDERPSDRTDYEV